MRTMSASTMIRRTRVEVDLDAVVRNARTVRGITGNGIIGVVKADAYGHGAVAVAQALERAKAANGFAVSLVEEGVALRAAGITSPVLVMGPSMHGGEDDLIEQKLTPVISSAEDLASLADAVKRTGRTVEAHLKVDTGMGRLGVALDDVGELSAHAKTSGVALVGLMTHFACADTDDPSDPECMTYGQLDRFAQAEAIARTSGAPIRVVHAANSSGALLFPEARFDQVRTGIAIYGNGRWPDGVEHVQAMRLVTEVAQLRTIPIGGTVGYTAAWHADRVTRVAVLPLGYADGLPRRASGKAQVAIRGKRVPLVGIISMDIAIADVTDIPDVAVGDAAVLLGRSGGGASITTAEYGAWAGLSEYEVTCGMSKRVPRTYVGDVT
jgi:alanine racemase